MPRKAKVISEENKRPYYGTMFDPPTNTRRATENEAVKKKQVKWYGMKLVSDEVSKQLGRSRKQIKEDVKKIKEQADKELEKLKNAQLAIISRKHDEQQGTTVKRRLNLVTEIKSMKQKEISIEKLGILENELQNKLKKIIEEEKKEQQLNQKNLDILNEIKEKEQKNVAEEKKIVKDAIIKVKQTKAKVIKSTANLPVVKAKEKRNYKKKDSQKKSNPVVKKLTKPQLAKIEKEKAAIEELNKEMVENIKKNYKESLEIINNNFKTSKDKDQYDYDYKIINDRYNRDLKKYSK